MGIIRFEAGKSYTQFDVQAYFKFDTERAAKDWIEDNNVLYIPVNRGSIWSMIGDHILSAMAVSARSHQDWQKSREDKRKKRSE